MIKIEIWSDINCPFCYIGKKHLEQALALYPRSAEVQVDWKSFELDPYGNPSPDEDNTNLLAIKYGKDRAWALTMNNNMTKMAKTAGIDMKLDQVVPANSFNAHRLLHLAKSYGKQDAMNEKLLSAKFSFGKNINDIDVLLELALSEGLPVSEVENLFSTDRFASDVRSDEELAGALGIRGVPFFVINGEYTLSGAQPKEAFLEVFTQI
jgi:predicted DsbA family dithiol-disulfide isomerase